ncbi:hypothetical protein E2C01_042552 [Portunus trituberculatus]|uniref:Uncharacterized protein n=1 Tax=Portunus trituberculatus TaxID=210409 RepID=A0A5B7FM46_PORTR|nr:hypothetical protein [Portunus trituberculatus]
MKISAESVSCRLDDSTRHSRPENKLTLVPQLLHTHLITMIPNLLCEGFIFRWASYHLTPLMDQQQFRNIKSSSTTHCHVDFLDYIYRNLEKRKASVILAFIDFRRAFYLVHHTNVITKTINLQLHSNLVSLLSDFLSHRSQVVRHWGTTSSFSISTV